MKICGNKGQKNVKICDNKGQKNVKICGSRGKGSKKMNQKSRICGLFGGVLLITALFFSSCRLQNEPESVWTVSAVGFDPCESGMRMTVEIPVLKPKESGEAQTLVLYETGKSVTEAFGRMQAGLAKKTGFSHCALIVLGEGLSRSQLEEIFDFAGDGERLPLAAEVVTAADALELLRAKSLSEPTVGYEIPEMLKRERENTGVNVGCSLYRLSADPNARAAVVLPHLRRAEKDAPMPVSMDGYDWLRAGAESLRLTREEGLPYAILADRLTALRPTLEGGEITVGRIKTELAAEVAEGMPQARVLLRLYVRSGGQTDDGGDAVEKWAEDLCARVKRFLLRLQGEGVDPLGFWEQALEQTGADGEWEMAAEGLTVTYEILWEG